MHAGLHIAPLYARRVITTRLRPCASRVLKPFAEEGLTKTVTL